MNKTGILFNIFCAVLLLSRCSSSPSVVDGVNGEAIQSGHTQYYSSLDYDRYGFPTPSGPIDGGMTNLNRRVEIVTDSAHPERILRSSHQVTADWQDGLRDPLGPLPRRTREGFNLGWGLVKNIGVSPNSQGYGAAVRAVTVVLMGAIVLTATTGGGLVVGVAEGAANGTYNLVELSRRQFVKSDEFATVLCTYYNYDAMGRLIEKSIYPECDQSASLLGKVRYEYIGKQTFPVKKSERIGDGKWETKIYK